MVNYFNPYTDTNFFKFIGLFFFRIYLFLKGELSPLELATDEIQIIVMIGVAISGSLVGTFLVLRKMTMLANALSHTLLLGIIITYLFLASFGSSEEPLGLMSIPTLMLASLVTGLVTTFMTEFLTRVIKLQEDASIGLIFTTFFASGIVLVTLFTRNLHIGTELIMGNVDALKKSDITSVFLVLGMNLVFIFLFFKGLKITTFDSGLSIALGFSPLFYHYLLMSLASATSISSFRAVGVLMVLAFFIFPVLIARLFTDSLIRLLFLSMSIGFLASLTGVALSRHILTVYQVGLSTGGLIVCFLIFYYVLALALSPKQGWIAHYYYKKKIHCPRKNIISLGNLEKCPLEKNKDILKKQTLCNECGAIFSQKGHLKNCAESLDFDS
jgi:manganese/zinc/iron transport system permease protein